MSSSEALEKNNLYQAARDGDLQTIEQILKQHENVNQQDDLDNTPLFYSVHTSQKAAALLLIEMGADIDVQNHRGDSPLHESVNCGQEKMVQFFIEQGADIELKNCMHLTPLGIAVEKDYKNIAKFLVEAGSNVNVRVGSSNTSDSLLHRAVSRVNLNRSMKMVELLLSNGADVQGRSGVFGYTPLYYARDYSDFAPSWLANFGLS